jgi:hypothetical protein
MTCEQLLRSLEEADIRLTVNGDMLHIDAPEEALTDELKAILREYKPELLLALQRKLCFHCANMGICDCVICAPGCEMKAGPCAACRKTKR